MTVAVIDYGSGNLRSAAKALERAVREGTMSQSVVVTHEADVVRHADRIVLPGVGAFADCKAGLASLPGMIDAITEVTAQRGRPLLGICVGMQLLADRGLENGSHEGLGLIPGDVVPITPDDPALKVPHMGWNTLSFDPDRHPILHGLPQNMHAYFVHSYHMRVATPCHCLATVDYGGPITAIVGRDTIVGTQFHPEKSQAQGLALLTNFLRWAP